MSTVIPQVDMSGAIGAAGRLERRVVLIRCNILEGEQLVFIGRQREAYIYLKQKGAAD